TAREPKLAAGVRLVPPGENTYGAGAPKEARRGTRAKICVVDYDGDGRLDLLVGDFATQKPDRPEPSAKEKAEQDKARKELAEVRKRYGELIDKLHGPRRVKDKAELEKVRKEMDAVAKQMRELQAKVPPEHENHGWVWLCRR